MINRFVVVLASITVAIGLFASAGFAAEERTMSLSASQFDFSAEPGQSGSGEVTVINEGDETISVRVYVADQVVAPDGTVSYVVPTPETEPLTSPASWITFQLPQEARSVGNIPYIELGPGQREPVGFEMTIPIAAPPGDRQAVLFFEMFDPAAPDPGIARVDARLGARISARVEGEVVEEFDVRPFELPAWVIGTTPAYRFVVRNEGNIDNSPVVRLAELDRSENERGSTTVLEGTPVYAGSTLERAGTFALVPGAIGPRDVRLVLTYTTESGLEKTVEKRRTVWAVPVWLLVAAATLLLGLLVFAAWAAGSRSANRRMAWPREVADEDMPRVS